MLCKPLCTFQCAVHLLGIVALRQAKYHACLQCLEAEFYSWVAYGEGIFTVNASLVGKTVPLRTFATALLHLKQLYI